MKFLFVFFAIGLSASEKLNRGYLPPPGANFAGGSLRDLQTPLAIPKENPISDFEIDSSHFREAETQQPGFRYENSRNFQSDIKSDQKDSSVASRNGYTTTTGHPRNGFKNGRPLVNEMEYHKDFAQNIPAGLRYSMKNVPIEQDKRLDNFKEHGYHYGKPGNMPIIGVGKEIIENYQPNAFGVYGGNPMIIKSQDKLNTMLGDHSGNNLNHPSTDRPLDEIYNPGFQNSDVSVPSSTPNYSNDPKIIYQSSTVAPVKTEPSYLGQRNEARKTFQKRPEQAESDRNAVILNSNNDLTPERYSYSFDTSNGIHIDESATTVYGVKALGSYSYTGDDGKIYSVIYSADENGFQPRGDHLPTPPPIPDAIKKVIEQANQDKEAGIFHDGSYDEQKYGHMRYQGPVNQYLQSMRERSKLRNKSRVLDTKKMYKKNIKNRNDRKHIEQDSPFKNFNAEFGMRKMSSVAATRSKPIDNQYKQNIDYQKPMPSLNEREQSDIPTFSKYHQQGKVQTPDSHSNKGVNNLNHIDTTSEYGPLKDSILNLNQNNDNPMETTIPDASYYYVPPRKIFDEGKSQKVSTNLKETVSNYYYINQRYNNGKLFENLSKTTSNTERPSKYTLSNVSGYSGNTNYDHNLETTSTSATNDTVFVTTLNPYESIPIKSFYDARNTKDDDQKETAFSVQNENGIPITRGGQDSVSTTPMPSTSYSSNNDNSIQYATTNPPIDELSTNTAKYPESDGYIYNKPKIPSIFEDFPSSTNTPLFTNIEIQAEPITNVQVDGFGRPIEDSSQIFKDTAYSGYFTTALPSNDELFGNKVKPTETYDIKGLFTDRATSPTDVELDFSEQDYGTMNDSLKITDTIIGEDFSGPKQSQRYDPATGYYY